MSYFYILINDKEEVIKTSFEIREISSQTVDSVFIRGVTLTSLALISLKYEVVRLFSGLK